VCHLGVKRKEELEEEEAKQPSLRPKELSLDEDETAKIPDYEQNKRLTKSHLPYTCLDRNHVCQGTSVGQ
jgi:hypothetical protein